LGAEPESNRVRYYLAEAVRDGATTLGVAVVRIEFDSLEESWARAAELDLVTDPNGVVFLASDPEYKYRFMGRNPPSPQARELAAVHYPSLLSSHIDFEVIEERGSASIVRVDSPEKGNVYLYQSLQLPSYGWTIHRFNELTSVRDDQRDGAIIGGTISALIISLVLYVIERHRAAALLQEEVAMRTRELRSSNDSLQTEIDEHRRTEARLRDTQNELVQAGKLAALGQMSAAIAHEINQPLAAMRTFLASMKIFAQRGDLAQMLSNFDLINNLAERMASITSHLKTFARKSEPGHPEEILVDRAVADTLFLLEGQIKAEGVRVEMDIAPDLRVLGHAVQLQQVILNLVRNAMDAVANGSDPHIWITARASNDTALITVSDNGTGIPADQIGQIFDPFFTTKPVGQGLGLGLSISYGIVQAFGGQIHARNRPEGGAELAVELPRSRQQFTIREAAAHA
jgi:two-component system C4-dicarboxylate transport sensor histidine kinase DctB